MRKGCELLVVQITKTNLTHQKPSIEDISVLREFQDVFLEEILELPLERDIDFTIDLVMGYALVSKAPY